LKNEEVHKELGRLFYTLSSEGTLQFSIFSHLFIEGNQQKMFRDGLVPPLLRVISESSESIQARMASVLVNMLSRHGNFFPAKINSQTLSVSVSAEITMESPCYAIYSSRKKRKTSRLTPSSTSQAHVHFDIQENSQKILRIHKRSFDSC
jgi:hypothetical protein